MQTSLDPTTFAHRYHRVVRMVSEHPSSAMQLRHAQKRSRGRIDLELLEKFVEARMFVCFGERLAIVIVQLGLEEEKMKPGFERFFITIKCAVEISLDQREMVFFQDRRGASAASRSTSGLIRSRSSVEYETNISAMVRVPDARA